jgi:hypothetical protein
MLKKKTIKKIELLSSRLLLCTILGFVFLVAVLSKQNMYIMQQKVADLAAYIDWVAFL